MQVNTKLSIPTEKDWENYNTDLDTLYAYDRFKGKSFTECYVEFKISPRESCFDLTYMPSIPFRYYTLALISYIFSENFMDVYKSDLISAFISSIEEVLINNPSFIKPIWDEIDSLNEKIIIDKNLSDREEDTYIEFKDRIVELRRNKLEILG